MKTRYLSAAAAAAIALGSAAGATVQVRVTDSYGANTNTYINTTAGMGASGSVSQNADDGFFSVTVGASGAPLNPDPNFSNFDFTVQSDGPLAVAHTLTIEFTNYNLSSAGNRYTVTNTLNTLQASGLSSPATLVSYLGTNTAYDTSIGTLSTLTCTFAQQSCANQQVTTLAHPASYSETVRYTFNFGAGTATSQTISGTNQIMAAATVPESATWAMMVLGFGAIGGALRTSRRKVVFA